MDLKASALTTVFFLRAVLILNSPIKDTRFLNMSYSLVLFDSSGRVVYKYNNKISPFNELVSNIVNETYTELDLRFFTFSGHHKKFYCYKKENIYGGLYFDVVTTIDNERIRRTLLSVLKTYEHLEEDDSKGILEKTKKMIDLQFEQLMKYNTEKEETVKAGYNLEDVKKEHGSDAQKKSLVASNKSKTQKAGKKKMRRWNNGEIVDDNADALDLDFSKDEVLKANGGNIDIDFDQNAFERENDLVLVEELKNALDDEDEDSEDESNSNGGTFRRGFFNKVMSYFGGEVDLNTLSKQFHDQLIAKNISAGTSKTILDRIQLQFGKKKTVSLEAFKSALQVELTKILSPNVSTDLLFEIKSKSQKGKPYVISVVGVNGVGKSTNLAKLAFWLLQNNLNVLICACDTFRSGAVEQLKIHVNNLLALNKSSASTSKINIFEKGYGGGNHVVATAKLAIEHAENEGYNVVLIDTAGRTHSNAKLMAPLKKFGDAANPDKIIMVGEALVGSDSVEQAINFNNAFGTKRNLDFFIISKVDTVGDMVGTMINMVMATNVPILFIGTGQTYTDIKRLSVKTVVDMLLK